MSQQQQHHHRDLERGLRQELDGVKTDVKLLQKDMGQVKEQFRTMSTVVETISDAIKVLDSSVEDIKKNGKSERTFMFLIGCVVALAFIIVFVL